MENLRMIHQLGSLYVGTSNGNTCISNNWTTTSAATAGTSSNSVYWGINGSYCYTDNRANYFSSIFEYLKEEEIIYLMDILIARAMETDDLKGIFQQINTRTFSEDFIMRYIDYFDLDLLKKQYSSQIKSQEYPRLALLVQAS
jgi:hypothetical protein